MFLAQARCPLRLTFISASLYSVRNASWSGQCLTLVAERPRRPKTARVNTAAARALVAKDQARTKKSNNELQERQGHTAETVQQAGRRHMVVKSQGLAPNNLVSSPMLWAHPPQSH